MSSISGQLPDSHRFRLPNSRQQRIDAQHAKGCLTARERLEVLLDEGSFVDRDKAKSDDTVGAVTGSGTINGRPVCVFSQDTTIAGGAFSEREAQEMSAILDLAMAQRVPVIGLYDSIGIASPHAVAAAGRHADFLRRSVIASGVIPQIAIIMGACIGGAALGPALADFTFMVKGTSHLVVAGPEVVRSATNEVVTMAALGGASPHATLTGIAHLDAEDDIEVLLSARNLLNFLPLNNSSGVPARITDDPADRAEAGLDTLVPASPVQPYDMRELILKVVDEANFFALQERHAANIVIGFGRIAGQTIGVVANQPLSMAGVIDGHASRKAARFIRFCDAFDIPIVTLVDVPGFLPGTSEEHDGLVSHVAKLLFAYAEASVPTITVVTRRAYGSAGTVMASKFLCGDRVFAWPTAEFGFGMGPGDLSAIDREIDEAIPPRATRERIAEALSTVSKKDRVRPRKKHGNIPL